MDISTILQIVALALGAVAILIIVINILKGLIRGFKKTLGSLVAVVLAIIVSAILTVVLCSPSSALVEWGMDGISSLVGGQMGDLFAVEELSTTLSYYAAMMVAPFFFMVCYSVLAIIFSIAMAIAIKFIPLFDKVKKEKKVLHRLGGAGVGLVCGYIVAVIVLMPVVGTLSLVTSMPYEDILVVEEENDETFDENYYDEDEYDYENDDEEEVEEIIDVMEEADGYVDIFMNAGCGPIYNAFASAKFEDERIYLKDDLVTIMELVQTIERAGEDLNDHKLNHGHIDMLNEVVDYLDESALLKNTVAGVFSSACEAWKNGEEFMGMEKMDVGELMSPVSDELISILADSSSETIVKDLHTMVDVFGVLVDSGILEEMGYDEMLIMLGEEGGVLDQLVEVVHKNEHMDPVADEISMLSVRAMASHLDMDSEEYEVLMSDIAGSLNSYSHMDREEKREHIESDLKEAFDEYGVVVEGAALDDIVEEVLDEFDGRDDVTEEDVANYFTNHVIDEIEDEIITEDEEYY